MRSSYNLDTIQKGDGPREKLLASGPDMLSDSELLAILFVTGTRNENVLELSGRVLREYGSRSIANIKDPNQVIEVLGLGPAKACQLVALFELGRRYYLEQ
ncbi:hypothetical protein KC717_06365, partial [Candidatus Dojkabacteria bacterium]|nr:hypothetical protein [Candidatus Dojkabacteria bacterium]